MPAVAAAALPSSVSQGGNVSQGGGSGTAVEVRKLKAALAARDVEIEELKVGGFQYGNYMYHRSVMYFRQQLHSGGGCGS